ncbi:MAG: hypothetical protein RMM53_12640, partial [Bacteroidia bacterium]|nr:hypothetical protein [Bacteroidia bacterium]
MSEKIRTLDLEFEDDFFAAVPSLSSSEERKETVEKVDEEERKTTEPKNTAEKPGPVPSPELRPVAEDQPTEQAPEPEEEEPKFSVKPLVKY